MADLGLLIVALKQQTLTIDQAIKALDRIAAALECVLVSMPPIPNTPNNEVQKGLIVSIIEGGQTLRQAVEAVKASEQG